MVCIYCGHKTQVSNSRLQKRRNTIWRRRKCTACDAVCTSIEKIDLSTAIGVRRTIRAIEPFDHTRLLVSIYDSCKHREDALKDAEALTATIVQKCVAKADNGIINLSTIAAEALDVLQRFDSIAATMYGAFHKNALSN